MIKHFLELVLNNLVENALKYSGSNIIIELKDDKISVIDSGIGIKEEHLEKITSKFYRVEKNSWWKWNYLKEKLKYQKISQILLKYVIVYLLGFLSATILLGLRFLGS